VRGTCPSLLDLLRVLMRDSRSTVKRQVKPRASNTFRSVNPLRFIRLLLASLLVMIWFRLVPPPLLVYVWQRLFPQIDACFNFCFLPLLTKYRLIDPFFEKYVEFHVSRLSSALKDNDRQVPAVRRLDFLQLRGGPQLPSYP